MQEKGLGTPATRAAIIEGLINEKYLIRDGREMIPTAKAFQLFTLLRGLGVEELSKPELTGGWEHKLALMEHGELSREAFMRECDSDYRRGVAAAVENFCNVAATPESKAAIAAFVERQAQRRQKR
jgi:DNA topoisomerase-3